MAIRLGLSTWRKWFRLILGIKVLVEHGGHHVFVVIVGFEFRRPQWQVELCQDHLPQAGLALGQRSRLDDGVSALARCQRPAFNESIEGGILALHRY